MGIYQRADSKVWWMAFSCNGKRIRRSTETANKRLAEKIHAKVLTQITEGKWFESLPGEERTFSEMMTRYMEGYSAINTAPSTHRRAKSTVKHIERYFGDFIVADIRTKDVSAYKEMRRKEGAAPKTVNNELILMGHAFNLALKEWEWVRDNPVSRVSKERVNNRRKRWLKSQEEERLLRASPEWLREIIVFALNTGLRRGEILNLKWSLVDLKRRTLTILEQKNGEDDTLPLNETVMEVLAARSKVRSISTDHVFLSREGRKLDGDTIHWFFTKVKKKAKVEDFRFHDLRHTFATRLVQAGVEIYKVQKLMRHKSPQMTQRYAHHYPESLRSGVEILDERVTFLSRLGQNNEKGATAKAVTP